MDRLDDAHVFLPDILAAHAHHYPQKTAVVCGARRENWQQFSDNINRVANRLLERGIGRGHKVAVVMSNSIEMLHVMFGVVRAGACVVPISGLLTTAQIAGLVNDCDASMLFVSAEMHDIVAPALPSLGNIPAGGFIASGFTGTPWQNMKSWIGDAPASDPGVNYAMEDPFNIIYSSGTTGLPKGIVQSHRCRHHFAYSNALEMGFSSSSRTLTTTSLYSNGTWLVALPALFTGGTLHVMPHFSPADFMATVEREEITHSFMVPTQLIVTLDDPAFGRFDLSSLQALLSAGSQLRPDLKQKIRQRLTPNIYEIYGFSEGFATMIKPGQKGKEGSVGVPVMGFEMRIIDDEGQVLPAGETGEIAGYGAGMMSEYYNKPAETAACIWRDGRGRSFIRSGDIGRVDEDGFLYILDRKKDMIISGGFNIFPADIEAIVARHPHVLDVTVIGIAHEKWGETPLALVIPKGNASASEDEIRLWANEQLAKTQRLAGVIFRQEFPRNALGKVLKRQLREKYGTWLSDQG